MLQRTMSGIWKRLTGVASLSLVVLFLLILGQKDPAEEVSTKEVVKLEVGQRVDVEAQKSEVALPADPPTRRPRFKDWEKVFKFVPNGLRACQKLFKRNDTANKLFSADYQSSYDLFLKEVKKHKITEGFSATYLEENLAYYQAVLAPFVTTVCETGFNAGHSSFMWLKAKPGTKVYSFDIGAHPYSRPLAKYLQSTFPDRLTVTWGDSTKTLPAFRAAHPEVKCDLLVIDGGHTYDVCQSDFLNYKQMANTDNIVILDNYPDYRMNFMTKLGNVWERAKQRGEIIEVFQCNYKPQSVQGFSMGKINTDLKQD